jgi:hypothetical protein
MYPKGWAVTPQPEIDSPFKIGGVAPGGFAGELQLRLGMASMEVPELLKTIRTHIWSKLTNYKETGGADGKWGRNNAFRGTWRDITFNIGDLAFHQRWYFFRNAQQNYMLIFTSPDKGWAKSLPVFEQILTTIEPSGRSKMIQSKPEIKSEKLPSWELGTLQDEAFLPLRMSYPKDWKVSKIVHGDDKEWKINGKNSAGHEAELHIASIPRGDLSLDRFVDAVEQDHVKDLKDYSKVSTGHRSVGGADGTTRSITFTSDEGLPGKMDMLFFADRERFYCVSLMTAAWSQEEMRNLFDRLYSTIKL